MKAYRRIIIITLGVLLVLAGLYSLGRFFLIQWDSKLYLHVGGLEVSKVEHVDDEGKHSPVSRISEGEWLGAYVYGPQQAIITLSDKTVFVLECYGVDTGNTASRNIYITASPNGHELEVLDKATTKDSNETYEIYKGVITIERGESNSTPYRIGWL